jgi:hypothetical protein
MIVWFFNFVTLLWGIFMEYTTTDLDDEPSLFFMMQQSKDSEQENKFLHGNVSRSDDGKFDFDRQEDYFWWWN